MKKWIRRVQFAAAALFSMIVIAGCSSSGSVVTTQLQINKDLSGVRAMDVSIDGTVFSEYFNGDIETLNAVITQECPEELTWSYENVDGTDTYHVELAFSSPEDYKKKVESILGSEQTLELSAPDSVWVTGFRVSEGFTTLDLLEFMESALVDQGLVDSSNSSYIFSSGQSSVVFNGETYSAYDYIQLNEIEYLPLDKVDILTEVNGADSFNRSFIIYIPRTSMSQKQEEIEAYLNGNVPAGASSEWGVYEDGTTMTITGKNMNLAELNEFNAGVLTTEGNAVTVSGRESDEGIFTFANAFREDMDLSAYGGNEYGTVTTGYYVKVADGLEMTTDYDASSFFYLNEDNDTYQGYGCAYDSRTSLLTVEALIKKSYQIVRADVTTQINGKDDFERTLSFTLGQTPAQEEQDRILAAMNDRIAQIEREEDLPLLETFQTDEGEFGLTVIQNGDAETIQEDSNAVFGGNTALGRAQKKGFLSVRNRFGFYENFTYEDFLQSAADGFTITYTVKPGSLSSFSTRISDETNEALAIAGQTMTVKGGSAVYETPYKGVSVTLSGYTWNIAAIVIWILLIAALAGLIIGLAVTGVFASILRDLKTLKEKSDAARQQKLAAAAAMQASQQYAAANPQDQALQEAAASGAPAAFCPECGQPNPSGAAFCENCGAKLTD